MNDSPIYPVDTIVAQATPQGRSGVGVIRLSGPMAVEILERIFHPKGSSGFPDRTAVYGVVMDPRDGVLIDDGLVLVMRSPNSYTGEDVVEISLHGSPTVMDLVCSLAVREGARYAQKGEFTRRAFLSGRMDLTQAEAVIDLIDSSSPLAVIEAQSRMQGKLSEHIREISNALKDILAIVEAHIDMDDDDELSLPDVGPDLLDVLCKIELVRERGRSGRIRRTGIVTIIVGKPNVGKSTLFNALLGRDRTIVTPYPGTTRDLVDDCLVLNGINFVLWDSAGIRGNPDPVEEEGILRTRDMMSRADLIMVVLDGSKPLDADDRGVMEAANSGPTIVVINKMDLPRDTVHRECTSLWTVPDAVNISAMTGQGMQTLKETLSRTADRILDPEGLEQALFLNTRSLSLIDEAAEPIRRLTGGPVGRTYFSAEIISYEVRAALRSLEGITGERVDEGVLDRIFERFCVGK